LKKLQRWTAAPSQNTHPTHPWTHVQVLFLFWWVYSSIFLTANQCNLIWEEEKHYPHTYIPFSVKEKTTPLPNCSFTLAYRLATGVIHNRSVLGVSERLALPACVYAAIDAKFPLPTGVTRALFTYARLSKFHEWMCMCFVARVNVIYSSAKSPSPWQTKKSRVWRTWTLGVRDCV
jgi:hypothetical protein